VAAVLLTGGQAHAASPCVNAPVATYTAPLFSCSVGGVTFNNLVVNTIGDVTLGNFSPITIGSGSSEEFGLSLTFVAIASPGSPISDVDWTYNVSGNFLNSTVMSFSGTDTGAGHSTLSETLSNGVTLSLISPGSTSATLSPVSSLGVIKDQINSAGSSGIAQTSALENAFSLTPRVAVSQPATLGLMILGLLGVAFAGRRRRN
jgi:hypothetical protein